jgi:PAS domain S-box-containing protein
MMNGFPGLIPEVRLLKKDGSEMWASLWWHPMIDRNGNIQCIGVILADITERMRVKQDLHTSEERFSSLLANVPGVVFRCAYDKDWTMILLSNGLEDISGYPASDVLFSTVRNYDSLIHPDDRNMVNMTISNAVEQREAYSLNYRIIHKDGSIRWVYERGQAVFTQNGKVLWLDGVILDVTDRKSAEAALQESEERYKSIVENSSDVIVLTRPDGTLAYISPACKTVAGYEPEELLDKKPWMFHPDDLERITENYQRALQGNDGSDLEYRVITKTGQTKWVSHSWSPIFSDGKLQTIVSVIRDITERKEVEETLVKARDDMERAYQLQRQFLNNVTHEVRTPLTAIQGYAKMILEGLAGPVSAEQVSLLHKVVCSSNDLIEMVAGVLEVARLKSGILGLRTKVCNPCHTVEKAVSTITPQAQQKGLKISVYMPSHKSTGVYDEEKLYTILTNLLANAIKFTDKGEIEVFVDYNETGVEIVIADTGMGIDQAHLGSIFDEFSQLEMPKKHKPTGFGIGLAIVATMVNCIGATLAVSSKQNVGTAFTLSVPTLETDRP